MNVCVGCPIAQRSAYVGRQRYSGSELSVRGIREERADEDEVQRSYFCSPAFAIAFIHKYNCLARDLWKGISHLTTAREYTCLLRTPLKC